MKPRPMASEIHTFTGYKSCTKTTGIPACVPIMSKAMWNFGLRRTPVPGYWLGIVSFVLRSFFPSEDTTRTLCTVEGSYA